VRDNHIQEGTQMEPHVDQQLEEHWDEDRATRLLRKSVHLDGLEDVIDEETATLLQDDPHSPPGSETHHPHTVSSSSSPHYSLTVCFCFTLNYVIGVGALGVPYAVRKGGVLLSSIVLVLVSVITSITVSWVVEAISVVHAMKSVKEDPTSIANPEELFEIKKKFEVTALCDVLLGNAGRIAFQISLLFLMYTGLWAYAAVFVSSIDGLIASVPSWALCLLFAVMVIPLSLLELTEQRFVQITLTLFRGLTFVLILVSSAFAIFTDSQDVGSGASPGGVYIAEQVWVDWSGFGAIFTTAVFSLLFQHSVPGLMHPLQGQNKKKGKSVFNYAIISCLVLYSSIGVLCNLYFGDSVKSSVNLNWKSFSFGYSVIPSAVVILSV
jgi:amino acid permease